MRLSVVIATKDRAARLERALDSLEAQRDAPAFEVIVADNGSSDGTRALVAYLATGNVQFRDRARLVIWPRAKSI